MDGSRGECGKATSEGGGEPRAVARRLGSSSIAALIEAYESGSTTAKLAEQYGISRTAVRDLLHARGVALRRPRGLGSKDIAEAARLYDTGWLLRETAEKFDVSQENVRRRLVELGVVMRNGHRRSRRPTSAANETLHDRWL